MTEQNNLASIDAGSNAIRLAIAHAESPSKLRLLKTERQPVRLGRHVFTERKFDRQTIDRAVRAFRHFRSVMDLYDVTEYRAVATSAAREARNQRSFIERIYESSGIRLEVIDGTEEARLVRSAVKASVARQFSPRLIADLGGGSLEISLMKSDIVEESVDLSIGTVRLMEIFDIQEAMTAEQVKIMRDYVLSLLRRYLPRERHPRGATAVVCGGNAEALALISPGLPQGGVKTLDLNLLRRNVSKIVGMDIRNRMRAFGVRKDRAEVMGIAAIVFTTLGTWWDLDNCLVPGVGVKEGVLTDLLRSKSGTARRQENGAHAEVLLTAARRFGFQCNWDARHAEKVRELAVILFDQLAPIHKIPPELRVTLEIAALLHDVGHVIRHRLHYKHGEYMVRHGNIPGLEESRRNMVACIVRYHSEPEPDSDDKLFTSFPHKQQLQIRALVALLRIADALDWEHRQLVTGIEARLRDQTVHLGLRLKHGSDLILWAVRRRAKLFESVFDREIEFKEIS